MDVLGRYRNLIILMGVLLAQILGLAVQVKRTSDTESTRLIRIWTVSAVTPFEKAIVWVRHSTFGVWHNYLYLRGVRQEGGQQRVGIRDHLQCGVQHGVAPLWIGRQLPRLGV